MTIEMNMNRRRFLPVIVALPAMVWVWLHRLPTLSIEADVEPERVSLKRHEYENGDVLYHIRFGDEKWKKLIHLKQS